MAGRALVGLHVAVANARFRVEYGWRVSGFRYHR